MDPDVDSASSADDIQSAGDENIFITDMHKEIKKFMSPDALTTEKIEAINHIGYIAYIGENIKAFFAIRFISLLLH